MNFSESTIVRGLTHHFYEKHKLNIILTRICAAEMAVRYAALSACRKVHVCHCNSLSGATWRSVTITGRTDRQTDRRTDRRIDRVRRNMRPPPREEGRIIIGSEFYTYKILSRLLVLYSACTARSWNGILYIILCFNCVKSTKSS